MLYSIPAGQVGTECGQECYYVANICSGASHAVGETSSFKCAFYGLKGENIMLTVLKHSHSHSHSYDVMVTVDIRPNHLFFFSIVTDEDLRGRNILHYHLFHLLSDRSTSALPPAKELEVVVCHYNIPQTAGRGPTSIPSAWHLSA